MERIWIDYDVALALKEIGYVDEVIYHYKHDTETGKHSQIPSFSMQHHFGHNHNQYPTRVSAPLLDQALEWLLKKYKIHIVPQATAYYLDPNILNWSCSVRPLREDLPQHEIDKTFISRRDAIQAGILDAVELIKLLNRDGNWVP